VLFLGETLGAQVQPSLTGDDPDGSTDNNRIRFKDEQVMAKGALAQHREKMATKNCDASGEMGHDVARHRIECALRKCKDGRNYSLSSLGDKPRSPD
jgi:hypothetical protein